MKKIISILLVFIYTVSVSGMVIQQRYCGSKLIDCGIAGTLKDCCEDMPEMKDCKKNCCLEKAEVVKVETAHEKPVSFKTIKIFSPVTFLSVFSSATSVNDYSSENFSSGIKLLPQKIPLRVLFSNFRI